MKNETELMLYDKFIYHTYKIEDKKDSIKITYFFEIPKLEKFEPSIEIPKKEGKQITPFVEELAFHIGLVELISYWKCCCPKNIIINCGYLSDEQIKWFKKLYFLGLGEFFYTNNIQVDENEFVKITCHGKKINWKENFKGSGSLIAIGGGKDSCVSLELTKDMKSRSGFLINPKDVSLQCAFAAGLTDAEIIKVNRVISSNIIKLNKQGFLNGHTPFSAMVAFVSYLSAFLNDKKYIILSNESSANESNVINTKINHQYSKSYEFEKDFTEYTKKYFNIDIHYFSILRPLTEYQIGMIFSRFPKYHTIFKSCNVGSKEIPWIWCGQCSKCLFVFSLLSPFLYKEKLLQVFHSDLFENENLLETFKELLGYGAHKPFDCVGTYEEVNYAITKTIQNLEKQKKPLPFLLNYYKMHYPLNDLESDLEHYFNNEHNVPSEFIKVLKEHLNDK